MRRPTHAAELEESVIFTLMDGLPNAWPDGPYRQPWQELLS
jgi:hypothetical protein